MNIIEQELKDVPKFGEKTCKVLSNLNIHNLFDLLIFLPYSYSDRTTTVPIFNLEINSFATVEGDIVSSKDIPSPKFNIYSITLRDFSGLLKISFFNLKQFQKDSLKVGNHIRVYGKVTFYKNSIQMSSPEIDYSNETSKFLTPIYHLTKGLKISAIRKYENIATEILKNNPLEDIYPLSLLPSEYNIPFSQALDFIHNPPLDSDLNKLLTFNHPCQIRIFLDELIAHQLSLLQYRTNNETNNATSLAQRKTFINQVIKSLPFSPTNAHLSAFNTISEELTKTKPMNRLLQGDVGSGKTLVAMLAALQTIANGSQVAVMVPTEILAKQHYISFENLISNYGFRACCITSNMKAAEKRELLKDIESGKINVIIGTHAIFQKNIIYQKLDLIIIDEQHRFGVKQRLQLKNKGSLDNHSPHMLSMSATPIPRTLAQTLYSDLDVSIINELPAGRIPIHTFILSQSAKHKLVERIRAKCEEGLQVYWVCCLIEESEMLECQDAQNAQQFLQQELPQFKVGLVHGKLKQQEKQSIMESFSNGEINILVATSVIEVGINVPNAFLIVIENPERHGLAQLHQLRGRVGRGTVESYCCLLCPDDLSENSKKRLNTLVNSTDGFYLAQQDLEFRGPGNLLGTEQTGAMNFKVAKYVQNTTIIDYANDIAKKISEHHKELIPHLLKRWYPEGTSLSDI